jgi:predicted dehydrogenase
MHGANGSIIVDGDDVKILAEGLDQEEKGEEGKASGASSPLAGFSPDPHRFQFEAIADAIHEGLEPPVSGKDSLKSLAIVLAVYESSKSNLPVHMDDFLKF